MKFSLPGFRLRSVRTFGLLCGWLAACLPVHEYAPDGWAPQTAAAANFVEPQEDDGAEERSFKPQTVINRHFKPIVEAPTVPAEKAGEIVRDHELVLGVEVNGEARAYPINLLCGPTREIINDVLGGEAIAATW